MKLFDDSEIYADNNATTPIDPKVRKAMLPYFKEKYGNPNSLHNKGSQARRAIEGAREKVANLFNAKPGEIVFTSCATESNNFAIKGAAFSDEQPGKHIITTKIEHDCILNTCSWLEEQGFDVTYIDVDNDGYISVEDIENALRDDTVLVSVIYANNEIGTIQPLKKISKLLEGKDTLLHTDAAQAPGKLNVDVEKLGVDMLTFNGHKMYAPKGVGGLYIKENIDIDPLLHGGGQEKGRRSGTEDVPYIVGLGKAAELANDNWKEEGERLTELHEMFIEKVKEKFDNIKINGPIDERLPGNVNVSFKGVEGESLLLRLNEHDIYVSTGSACASESLEASHVLESLSTDPEYAHSSIRIGFGRFNDESDVEKIIDVLEKEVEELKSFSAFEN